MRDYNPRGALRPGAPRGPPAFTAAPAHSEGGLQVPGCIVLPSAQLYFLPRVSWVTVAPRTLEKFKVGGVCGPPGKLLGVACLFSASKSSRSAADRRLLSSLWCTVFAFSEPGEGPLRRSPGGPSPGGSRSRLSLKLSEIPPRGEIG